MTPTRLPTKHQPPRQDTTRLGPARTIWEAQFQWEGKRLLGRLDDLPITGGPLIVHAYVSESPEVRAGLKNTILQKFRERGQSAAVHVRSAYKTGYFWAAEEIQPLWRRHQADRLSVTYPVIAPATQGRFLQELYPLAALLEREGVRAELKAGGSATQYEAVLYRGETVLWHGACAVPLHHRTSPDGREVFGPTGWLTVKSQAETLHDERLPTDGELFWDWYGEVVLPHVLNLAGERPGLPIFKNLSVNLHLSEPDFALDVLDERVSMTEALTEEIYFGTLDALKQRAGTPVSDRSLIPGRIAPVATSTPGQNGWVRVTLTPWGESSFPPEFTAETAPALPKLAAIDVGALSTDRPWKPAHIWAYARQQAEQFGLEWAIPAYSVDGRPVPTVLRRSTADQPEFLARGVLLTSGQHANETTGPVAAAQLIGTLAANPLPFAVLPLENPDGAHLHRALTQLNPEHMHHAARYTSLGDDLEFRLRNGDPRWEARARAWAAGEIGASLHLNLHGYPAHEWVRPYSGYAPFGFESWALPAGFLTIIRYHSGHQKSAHRLADAIATRLTTLDDVVAHTTRACRTGAAHSGPPHYELIRGLPFLLAEYPEALCPLTVITEAPDETIYGQRFAMFVRAHQAVCEAAIEYHRLCCLTQAPPPA
ncbi:M14 family metallopeptidase [Deinococcus detaillensis]|uniref:zinc carboxypeptidase n=1 Tax=Deinococcus detaillensis TaxID=2592048 RepID=UPI001CDD2B93|nr:zinc carboxypeptidase [Deinococcus detaillensis]